MLSDLGQAGSRRDEPHARARLQMALTRSGRSQYQPNLGNDRDACERSKQGRLTR